MKGKNGNGDPRIGRLHARLLRWGGGHRADFPWRRSSSAYRILVAEFMLHRTQAPQVVPTYLAFLREYPTLRLFVEGDRRRARKLLARLGLAWRSEAMIRALHSLWREYGEVPADYAALMRISGIGPYIAGATVCFSKNRPIALVDSNTVRVVGRVLGLDLRGEARRRKSVREALDMTLHRRRPRDYHLALIDLAHGICRPKSPDCSSCPLREVPCMHGAGRAQQATARSGHRGR